MLPALKRPTVSHLSDDDWLAVNTILDESTVRDDHPASQAGGRRGDRRISAEQDRNVIMLRILESKDMGRLSGTPHRAAHGSGRGGASDSRRGPASAAIKACSNMRGSSTAWNEVCSRVRPRTGRSGDRLTPAFRSAVEVASANVRALCGEATAARIFCFVRPGMRLGQIVRPLDTVALTFRRAAIRCLPR